MERNVPILYRDKGDCCGCGACMNICPRNAIMMVEDECGFLYPRIDESLCVKCQRCTKVCAFQNHNETNTPQKVYAATSKDNDVIMNSSSGGVFTTLAVYVIENGGIVFGAAFDSDWNVKHIAVKSKEQLRYIRGSKYTQSLTGTSFRQVRELLDAGRFVLYSGTPCQIAGLKGFLGKEYDNLLTVDLVCHGVPNNRMLRDYIKLLEKNEKGKIIKFTFRDKSIGWGKNGSVVIESSDGKRYKKKLWESASSYPYYFAASLIYRENCYKCKYAKKNRPGDITLGDYWGIEKQHPEYLKGQSGWDERKGISVIIANTSRGIEVLNKLEEIEMRLSSFEKAAQGNGQLDHPSEKGKREEVVNLYRIGGWDALEDRYQREIGIKKYFSQVKAMIPQKLKRWMKSIL